MCENLYPINIGYVLEETPEKIVIAKFERDSLKQKTKNYCFENGYTKETIYKREIIEFNNIFEESYQDVFYINKGLEEYILIKPVLLGGDILIFKNKELEVGNDLKYYYSINTEKFEKFQTKFKRFHYLSENAGKIIKINKIGKFEICQVLCKLEALQAYYYQTVIVISNY